MSDFSPIEALLMGFTPDEVAALQMAISDFDGSYRKFMDHLRVLDPVDNIWRAVNTAIIEATGKRRDEVDRYDWAELEAWTDGYDSSRKNISAETLNRAAAITLREFSRAIANLK